METFAVLPSICIQCVIFFVTAYCLEVMYPIDVFQMAELILDVPT
jgi:hypothetical protein